VDGAYVASAGVFVVPAGPISPDHIVYSKPFPLVGDPTRAGVARCSLSPTRARIHLSWASWTDLNAGLAQLDG
jgi:hypothetical protein